MTRLLPTAFSGFTFGTPTADKSSGVVVASPSSGGGISHVQWSVYDRTNASGAAKFITKVSKSLYGRNGSSVKLDGVKGYFGTDGQRLAAVSFARGRYVFEVVLTSSTGSPLTLKAKALQAAATFPSKL